MVRQSGRSHRRRQAHPSAEPGFKVAMISRAYAWYGICVNAPSPGGRTVGPHRRLHLREVVVERM